MEFAKLEIHLPFKLDNYSMIKRFIDIVKSLFPEQTNDEHTYPYSNTSNYQFSLRGSVLNKTYYGTKEFFNVIYREKQIGLNRMSISNFEQGVTLVCMDASTIILAGNDIATLERFEAQIKESLRTNQNEPHNKDTSSPFMEKDFGDLELPCSLFDKKITSIINYRISEIKKAFNQEMPLSAILLLGSTLEGALYLVAQKYPEVFNAAKSSPKNKDGKVFSLGNWTLNNLIEVACEVGVLEKDIKEFSKVVRDFRNYIHPKEQAHQDFSPSMETVGIAYQVVKGAFKQISAFIKYHDPQPL